MDLRVSTSLVGETVVVALDGTADLAAAPALHAALARATARSGAGHVVIDLDGVAVLDDVALGLLIGAAARARAAGGSLSIVCAGARMRERLSMTRVDHIVRVHASIAATAPGDARADRYERGAP